MRAAKFSLSLIDTVVSRCKNRRRDSIVCAFTIHLIHVHVCTCIISFKLLSLKFSSHSAETWKQAVIEARCRWSVGARRRWRRQLGAGWRHTEDTIADAGRYHGVWRRVWLARWGGLGMARSVVIDISCAQPIFLESARFLSKIAQAHLNSRNSNFPYTIFIATIVRWLPLHNA